MRAAVPTLPNLSRRALLGALAAIGWAGPAGAAGRAKFQIQAGKIVAPVMLNGQAVDALIDSGAQLSAIDSSYAKARGLRSHGLFMGRGVQGRVWGSWADGLSVSIGGASLARLKVAVIDYEPLSRQLGRPVQVVLGRDLFEAFVVELDFAAGALALHPRESFQAPAGARLSSLKAVRGRMTTTLSVEGGAPVQALVDLGNDLPLILSPSGDTRRLVQRRPVSTALIGGYGSGAVGQVTTARYIVVDGLRIDEVPVNIAPRAIGFGANLGLPVLQRFHLWLDFGGRRMWLAPGGRAKPFFKDRTGLNGYADGDLLRITHVARGGPAERAGFKAGEAAATINGQPAALANAALTDADDGRTLEFVMTNGARRRLVLAEYY